jgi:hypothetical protein
MAAAADMITVDQSLARSFSATSINNIRVFAVFVNAPTPVRAPILIVGVNADKTYEYYQNFILEILAHTAIRRTLAGTRQAAAVTRIQTQRADHHVERAVGPCASYPSQELSCPSVRFNARVGTGTEDARLWINGDGRVRT